VRRPLAAALTGLAAMLLAPLAVVAAPKPAPTVSFPIPAYPVAQPLPVGLSKVPSFMDDDEQLRVHLDPFGHILSLLDDIRIKVGGGGDFNVLLPGLVRSVADLGGDEVPGMVDNRVSFQGFLSGTQKIISAEAALDPRAYAAALPLSQSATYLQGGRMVSPLTQAGHAGTYDEQIQIANLTGTVLTLPAGAATNRAQLAQVLDALRGIADLYTPETDLGAVFPLPPTLSLGGTVIQVAQPVFVPMRLVTTMRLPAGVRLVDGGGADVTADSRGTLLRWTMFLPAQPGGEGTVTLRVSYATPAFRVPAVETLVDIRPLPAALYKPPSGASWAAYLKTAPALASTTLLAEGGLASLHRIGDVGPPVGRPGPGPENVRYDLVLDSGRLVPKASPARPPSRPQAWAVALAALGALVLSANAYWAWSRH
jgi:hypothetical protein